MKLSSPLTMLQRLRTYAALGSANLARVGAYRLALRHKIHPVQRLRGKVPSGTFFFVRPSALSAKVFARTEWWEEGVWFGSHHFDACTVPDWHTNPFTDGRMDASLPWFAIGDFDPGVGDIKGIWEVSRFNWLLAMAQRAALGDAAELARLNYWLKDWVEANPPYYGVNWKCGQEVSIRIMHLALAALVLDQTNRPLPGLFALIRLHLRRIAPTIGYAIGQANNHGTSEAAALFIGGSWLGGREGARWARMGQRWLEDRAQALITQDGTFSQYSLVYHRVMLDSYALAECWRRMLGLPAFSPALYERLRAATLWLQAMTIMENGDVPNIGANDGARLLPLTDTDYRDFRPSLQLASALFAGARAIEAPGVWDQPLLWLGIDRPDEVLPPPGSITFDDGGFHVLRTGTAMAVLRYPRFRFRPSQADALHLDLWLGDRNLLRDAGSFSYASEDGVWFGGTSAHNTVEFDDRDQMPRLGRFLFGAWLKADSVEVVRESENGRTVAAAGYCDAWGARHHRQISLHSDGLDCIDRLDGNARKAVLRWRLAPGDWRLSGDTLTDGKISLRLSADTGLTLRLKQAPESRYYLQREDIPVLEAETTLPATITTQVSF